CRSDVGSNTNYIF
nr:immunoglobulin light chain junction region [Macaca mulatta]MPN80138.1 immunoglobulin light chain junction region [Macaca mulatta]MPN80449.1 immunoglobulin light chain junction region [Macaca mulatta]MPN81239.1 immunoglobulin light chain junction region [Macaca mulatta]